MSNSSRRRYNLMHSNAPHRRSNKFTANLRAWECRRGQIDPFECSWFRTTAGCPWSRLGIDCNAVQEGHWTLLYINWSCRDMRRYYERRQKARQKCQTM